MARLPTRDDLGGLPSARSGRVIANYDTSAIGRGVAAGGEARGRGLANLGAAIAGAATDIGRIGATAGSSRGIGGVGQAEQFEAQRRFLEFNAAQEQAYEESKGTVDPGAFGFREKAQQNYLNSAKEFFKTIPDALKPEYDMKLFQAEDNILSKSRAFETTERVRYYGEEVNKGLGTLENNLFSNPGNFDKNYSEGVSFINAIPDESLSRIQKADLVKQWRTKAQLASLNGVSPQERIRLLGGAPNPVQTQPTAERGQAVTRGMPGEIRQVVSDAAARYGVDPNALLTIAWIESRGNPNAKNPNSSAGGLFQFIDSTARGYGLSNKFDPAQAADAAARLARDNSQALEGVLGRKPTAGELYLAHQQGIGGATKLLSNPNAKAVDLVGADAVRLNGGSSNMTAGDFAMLWMKKAGDTHVPDGGFMGAQYDASRADPRFADMNYADAQKIIQGSQSEINNSITLAERARAEEATRAAAALKATQAQANDEYRLRIATDDQTLTEQMILDDARIDAGTKATLINSYQTAQKENAGVNDFIQSIGTGGVSVNQFDPEQTKIADKAFDKIMNSVSDPEQAASVVGDFVEASGYVPKRVQSELRRGVASTDAEEVARSMQTANVLRSGAPTSFNNFEGGDAVRKGLDLFTAYTEKMGFAPEEAAQKIIDLNDPEKMRVRDAIIKSEPVKKVLKDVSADDVAAIFDKGVFSAAPDVGGVAGVEGVKIGVNSVSEAAIVSDYRSILEESIADANGDMDAAKELAKTRFSRTYGTTEFSPLGSDIVMRYPPEKAYPVGPDGTHGYIRNQAMEALKAEGVNPDVIYLQGDNGTEQDIKAGRPARYQVFYEQDGKVECFFLPFFADPSAAKAEEQGKKEQSLKDAEGRMIENRARFQSESEADQRILDETVGPDWMKAQQMMGQQERRRQDETIQQFQGDRPSITGGGGGGGY
jgi:hypothetical protein